MMNPSQIFREPIDHLWIKKGQKLKILFFGAGVIGSFYGAKLSENGHRVTMLARNQRYHFLKENGIVLENAENHARTVHQVEVIDRLEPDDEYDLIVVTVRRDQVEEVIPHIAANRTLNILFMVNNCLGNEEWSEVIGAHRIMLGFPAAGGYLADGVVSYFVMSGIYNLLQIMTFGEINGTVTSRIRTISQIFREAGFATTISRHMDAWLKTHIALVTPVANAIYKNKGSNYDLAKEENDVKLVIQAVREGFKVLKKLNIPVTPINLNFFNVMPRFLLVPFVRFLLNSRFSEIMIARHANYAVTEMKLLAEEFGQLIAKSVLPSPAINELMNSIPAHI